MISLFRSVLRCNLLRALLLLAFLWLAGCSPLTTVDLPPGLCLEPLTITAPGAVFAAHTSGARIAVGGDTLTVVEAVTGASELLDDRPPLVIAWSQDGRLLAAAFASGEGSVLRLFDGAAVARQTAVAGRVSDLAWLPGGDLLVAATVLKHFSFGSDFRTTLYRWDGVADPHPVTAHNITVKPLTVHRWGSALYGAIRIDLAPQGDAVVYTRLHDPPAFSPYLKLVLLHLDSGAERVLADVGLASGGGVHAGDDTVVYGDGRGLSLLLDPWTGRKLRSWETPGHSVAASAGGRYLLLDGRLYREGDEVAAFPDGSGGHFAPGGQLFLRIDRRLYRLAGLEDDTPASLEPAVSERLLELRRWRSEGLITHDELLQQRERMEGR